MNLSPRHLRLDGDIPVKTLEEVREALNWYLNEQFETRARRTEEGLVQLTHPLPAEFESAAWFAGYLQGALEGHKDRIKAAKARKKREEVANEITKLDADHPLAWVREQYDEKKK